MANENMDPGTRMLYQTFLRDRALEEDWTHFITLNFHRRWDSSQSHIALGKWAHSVCHHMFRRAGMRPSGSQRGLYFFAYKEFTKSGDPHWHVLVDANGPGAERLPEIARAKWRAIVRSGTSDVQAIGGTEADRQRVVEYVTKAASTAVALDDFCISTEFGLPAYCGSTAQTKCPDQ